VEEGLRVSFPQPFDLNLTFLTPARASSSRAMPPATMPASACRRQGDVNGDGFADLIVGARAATMAAAMPARPMSCSARPRASARSTALAVR
jgi:hypothetical protein